MTQKSIDHIIDEWFRMRSHPKYNNIDPEFLEEYLVELFELLRDSGYKYEDLGVVYANRIRKMCMWEDGAKRINKERWIGRVNAAWNSASRKVFPSDLVSKEVPESQNTVEESDFDHQDTYTPIDRSLIHKDLLGKTKYDEDIEKLLEVPEDWNE